MSDAAAVPMAQDASPFRPPPPKRKKRYDALGCRAKTSAVWLARRVLLSRGTPAQETQVVHFHRGNGGGFVECHGTLYARATDKDLPASPEPSTGGAGA